MKPLTIDCKTMLRVPPAFPGGILLLADAEASKKMQVFVYIYIVLQAESKMGTNLGTSLNNHIAHDQAVEFVHRDSPWSCAWRLALRSFYVCPHCGITTTSEIKQRHASQ
jgi:hypothetical protein